MYLPGKCLEIVSNGDQRHIPRLHCSLVRQSCMHWLLLLRLVFIWEVLLWEMQFCVMNVGDEDHLPLFTVKVCNEATMKVLQADELSKAVKHVSVRYWWTRESVEKKIMRLEYVRSDCNVADVQAKVLASSRMNQLLAQAPVGWASMDCRSWGSAAVECSEEDQSIQDDQSTKTLLNSARQVTERYFHASNGLVKRVNRILMNKARYPLIQGKLHNSM